MNEDNCVSRSIGIEVVILMASNLEMCGFQQINRLPLTKVLFEVSALLKMEVPLENLMEIDSYS